MGFRERRSTRHQQREQKKRLRAQEKKQRSAKRWMGIDIVFDEQGQELLADTPGMRAEAFRAYDGSITMEKRGHELSEGFTWSRDWQSTIRSVRKGTQNPEVYVAYIIAQRRAAGLPELEMGEEEP